MVSCFTGSKREYLTYRGRRIAPNPPRPLYPELLPRNPLPRGGLLDELIPGLLVRFGIT